MQIADIPNIPELLDAETVKRIRLQPHPTNRASEAGHPCVRFLVLARTQNHLRSLPAIDLQRIFDEGNLHEDALMRDLAEARVDVYDQQRAHESSATVWPPDFLPEWRDRLLPLLLEAQLTGSTDGRIPVNGCRIPLEIKSSSPNVYPAICELTPIEMLKSKFSWIRKYPAQEICYMLMDAAPYGVMVFKNKGNGAKCQKIFEWTDEILTYAESILKKLHVVNAHVAAGTAPEAALIDDCRGCAFAKTACFPGEDYGPGIDIRDDPELAAKLDRRGALEAASKEFEALDKEIKDSVKGQSAVVGDWIIQSSERERRGVDLPAELKKQYEKVTKYFVTKIERM